MIGVARQGNERYRDTLAMGAVLLFALVWMPSFGFAESVGVSTQAARPDRNYGNLRVGAATASSRPEICLEMSPTSWLGLEACGTGKGLWHNAPGSEVARFRGHATLASWHSRLGYIQPRVGLGLAELQVGDDDLGFDLFGTGPLGTETAGPEVSLSMRTLTPLKGGFELVTQVEVSAAYFRYAPALIRPRSALHRAASVSFGFGF